MKTPVLGRLIESLGTETADKIKGVVKSKE
jgi:hypothetical protein